jgi:hypothetical protein
MIVEQYVRGWSNMNVENRSMAGRSGNNNSVEKSRSESLEEQSCGGIGMWRDWSVEG